MFYTLKAGQMAGFFLVNQRPYPGINEAALWENRPNWISGSSLPHQIAMKHLCEFNFE